MKRVADTQRPLPFKFGMPAARRKPAKRWKWIDGSIARICPSCGCSEHARCTLVSEGAECTCVPAGVFGQRVCSGCKQIKLPFGGVK